MVVPSSIVTDLASSTSLVLTGSKSIIIVLFAIGITFYIAKSVIEFFPKI